MVRSSSAGSSSSRRASLLSDAGRASSRSSLQQQLTESFTEQGEQQQQQQPARPNISQLPLHLLAGNTDPSVPPSVALQQVGTGIYTVLCTRFYTAGAFLLATGIHASVALHGAHSF